MEMEKTYWIINRDELVTYVNGRSCRWSVRYVNRIRAKVSLHVIHEISYAKTHVKTRVPSVLRRRIYRQGILIKITP